jgi:hypothetical protein
MTLFASDCLKNGKNQICSSFRMYSKISFRLVLFVFTISNFKMFLSHVMFFAEDISFFLSKEKTDFKYVSREGGFFKQIFLLYIWSVSDVIFCTKWTALYGRDRDQKYALHIANFHIKRSRITINYRIGSIKKMILKSNIYTKSQIKRPLITSPACNVLLI